MDDRPVWQGATTVTRRRDLPSGLFPLPHWKWMPRHMIPLRTISCEGDPLVDRASLASAPSSSTSSSQPIPHYFSPDDEPLSTKTVRHQNLFRQLDRRRRGWVDEEDLTIALCNVAQNEKEDLAVDTARVPAMARALLREVGQSKHVNEEAFVKWVEKREKELWRVFKSIDTSGDNTLQVNELRSFVKKAGLKVGEDDFQKFVNGVVGGEGGAVGFEEWRDFLLLMPHKPTPHNILTFYSTLYNIDPTSDFTPLPETLSERDDDDASSSSPQPSTLPPRLKYFICGGMAGAVSRTATAPLDRVKVLLVTNASQQSPPPLLDTLKLIYSQGGLRSFYRGNMLNVIKIVPESGVKFLTFELAKTWIADFERQWESGEANTNNGEEQWDGERRQELSVAGRFCAGGMAGLVSQAVIYPLETVKVRWMAEINQSAKSADPTVPSTATISSSTGISQPVNGSKPPSFLTFIRTPIPLPHLYRGCAAALVGIVPYAGIDLGIYETLRRKYEIYLQNKYQREDVDMHSGVLLGIGAVSAISGAGVMYPLSVVRTRMQAQHTPSHPYTYTSTFDAAYKTYKIEGVRGFYKGIAPTLCKVLPAVSISYVVYEWCKTVL